MPTREIITWAAAAVSFVCWTCTAYGLGVVISDYCYLRRRGMLSGPRRTLIVHDVFSEVLRIAKHSMAVVGVLLVVPEAVTANMADSDAWRVIVRTCLFALISLGLTLHSVGDLRVRYRLILELKHKEKTNRNNPC